MKKYVSSQKASVDLHAGAFFWERFVVSLEIAPDGSATYERCQIDSGNAHGVCSEVPDAKTVRYAGSVVQSSDSKWIEMRFPLPDDDRIPDLLPTQAGVHLVVRAVEVDNELICHFYSESSKRSWSELLAMQNF